ncbi:ras-related protein Rab-37, partial [Caerostris extrusa]
EYGRGFMETSAKNRHQCELAFMAVARELKHRQSCQQDQESKFNVKEYVRQGQHKSKSSGTCCVIESSPSVVSMVTQKKIFPR